MVSVRLMDGNGEKDGLVTWINLPKDEAVNNYMGKTLNMGPRYVNGVFHDDHMMRVTEVNVLREDDTPIPTEAILYALIYGGREVKSRDGMEVIGYGAMVHDTIAFREALVPEGFEERYNDGYSALWTDMAGLRSVEYVEGDIYVATYDSVEVMERDIEKAMENVQ